MSQNLLDVGSLSEICTSEIGVVEHAGSAYEKVYWFARALIDEETGGKGADINAMTLLNRALDIEIESGAPDVNVAKKQIRAILEGKHRPGTKIAAKVARLADELDGLIESPIDLEVLRFTITHILIPTNILLQSVPTDDRSFAELIIRSHLEESQEAALIHVIETWDRLGSKGAMKRERDAIVAGFRILRRILDKMESEGRIGVIDSEQALTAFIQEFERRLSRGVRPKRAGRSLEDVTGVILDHFQISNYTDAPAHIRTAFEVDKMIQLADGWKLGVSCKRTLRERWKQAATLDTNLLDKHKIRNVLHVITYPGDLSKQKVMEIGHSRGVLYIPDDSDFYVTHRNDPELAGCLRPISRFISDLKSEWR